MLVLTIVFSLSATSVEMSFIIPPNPSYRLALVIVLQTVLKRGSLCRDCFSRDLSCSRMSEIGQYGHTAVLDRLGVVLRKDLGARFEVRDRPRDLQNPLIRARRKLQAPERVAEELFGFARGIAVAADQRSVYGLFGIVFGGGVGRRREVGDDRT